MLGRPVPRELPLPVRRALGPRVLAALAHLAGLVVPRLPLHPAGRLPGPDRSCCGATCSSSGASTGLWHGAAWTFVVWGLYFGVVIGLERSVYGDCAGPDAPACAARVRRSLVAVLGWVHLPQHLAAPGRRVLPGHGRSRRPPRRLGRPRPTYAVQQTWVLIVIGCLARRRRRAAVHGPARGNAGRCLGGRGRGGAPRHGDDPRVRSRPPRLWAAPPTRAPRSRWPSARRSRSRPTGPTPARDRHQPGGSGGRRCAAAGRHRVHRLGQLLTLHLLPVLGGPR